MIISASIDQESNTILNHLEQHGFAGKSEVIRSALKLLWDEHQNKANLSGTMDAVMLIKHSEKHTGSILTIRHDFENLIKTHVHTHLENHKCLELLILKGDAQRIKKLASTLETSKKVELVKLIIS